MPPKWQLGLQLGIGHESNGFEGDTHKSINTLYLRPIFSAAAQSNNFFITLAPKAYIYIGPMGLNPDIARYRGFVDLRIVTGWRDGLQLAFRGRLGSNFDKGSALLDLTYPFYNLSGGNIDMSLTAQYFVGYGEGLLGYRDFEQFLRFGVTLVR